MKDEILAEYTHLWAPKDGDWVLVQDAELGDHEYSIFNQSNGCVLSAEKKIKQILIEKMLSENVKVLKEFPEGDAVFEGGGF